jgi:hypothetical protein
MAQPLQRASKSTSFRMTGLASRTTRGAGYSPRWQMLLPLSPHRQRVNVCAKPMDGVQLGWPIGITLNDVLFFHRL